MRALFCRVCVLLCCSLSGSAWVQAAIISHLDVRIAIGAAELPAGSELELRIYEPGKIPRRLPLAHGEAWLPNSTHLIPLSLGEALDSRNIARFALYFRAASALAAPLEITALEVQLAKGQGLKERLLNTTLSGVITRQGELASAERDAAALICASDADCDDGRACDGRERCAPQSPGADARGCLGGVPVACPVNQVCGEKTGCYGPPPLKQPEPARAEQSPR